MTKIRLTGGEPLLRRDLPLLVELLAGIDGLDDLAMTTNGSLLAMHAGPLARAGLRRVTVSLDSLDDDVFGQLNDVGMSVARVVGGIEAAEAAGLGPIKIDTVVRRGINESSILPLAREARRRGWIIRFIEYMDVGTTNGWRMEDVVPAAEILAAIDSELPLEPVAPSYPGEVASRYRYRDGSGEMGVIASVTRPFCATCTRARLSAEGQLYLCLFGMRAHDLKGPLRAGTDDEALADGSCVAPGSAGPTATRRSAPRRRPTCRAWRCRTSVADRDLSPRGLGTRYAVGRTAGHGGAPMRPTHQGDRV